MLTYSVLDFGLVLSELAFNQDEDFTASFTVDDRY